MKFTPFSPKPITVELTAAIRLVSGRVFAAGTRFNVIPHPRGAFYSCPAYLAMRAFESCGIPCDLSVFADECVIVQ
jgi:hypothetical protein